MANSGCSESLAKSSALPLTADLRRWIGQLPPAPLAGFHRRPARPPPRLEIGPGCCHLARGVNGTWRPRTGRSTRRPCCALASSAPTTICRPRRVSCALSSLVQLRDGLGHERVEARRQEQPVLVQDPPVVFQDGGPALALGEATSASDPVTQDAPQRLLTHAGAGRRGGHHADGVPDRVRGASFLTGVTIIASSACPL